MNATYHKPNPRLDAAELAACIAPADAAELARALPGADPAAVILAELAHADAAATVRIGGMLAAVFGARLDPQAPGEARIFCLTTTAAAVFPIPFIRATRPAVAALFNALPGARRLTGRVWSRHPTARRWLTHIGAAFGDPAPLPPAGHPFTPFSIERASPCAPQP